MKLRLNPLVSILLFMIASSLLLYLLESKRLKKQNNNASADAFVKATIKGRLVFKSLKYGVQSIRVDNDSQTFRFIPEITPKGSLFHANTDMGDSIIKKANSMNVVVKNAEAVLRYATKAAY